MNKEDSMTLQKEQNNTLMLKSEDKDKRQFEDEMPEKAF